MRKKMQYEVWRYHVLQIRGTFQEVRAWLVANLPEGYRERAAKSHRYDGNNESLRWITSECEYCAIKKGVIQ